MATIERPLVGGIADVAERPPMTSLGLPGGVNDKNNAQCRLNKKFAGERTHATRLFAAQDTDYLS